MAEHTVIQGDDFPYDFDSDGIDSFLSGWIGRWSIVDKIGPGGVSVASGTLAPSGDGEKMELRIKPSTTEAVRLELILWWLSWPTQVLILNGK